MNDLSQWRVHPANGKVELQGPKQVRHKWKCCSTTVGYLFVQSLPQLHVRYSIFLSNRN